MSYILEALKKSDKERQREEIPDLQADHSFPSAEGRRRKKPLPVYLLAVLVLCSVATLAWWLLTAEQAPQLAETRPKTPTSSVTVQTPESQGALQQGAPTQTKEKKQVVAEVAPAVVRKETVSVVKESPPSPTVQTPESQAILQQSAPLQAEEEKQEVVAGVAPVMVREETVELETEEPAEEPPLPAPSQAVDREEAAIPLLDELPAAVKNRIPALSFSGHVYGNEPAKRMIIINNRIVREGESLGNGVSLERIEANGVILHYEAVIFRVDLF